MRFTLPLISLLIVTGCKEKAAAPPPPVPVAAMPSLPPAVTHPLKLAEMTALVQGSKPTKSLADALRLQLLPQIIAYYQTDRSAFLAAMGPKFIRLRYALGMQLFDSRLSETDKEFILVGNNEGWYLSALLIMHDPEWRQSPDFQFVIQSICNALAKTPVNTISGEQLRLLRAWRALEPNAIVPPNLSASDVESIELDFLIYTRMGISFNRFFEKSEKGKPTSRLSGSEWLLARLRQKLAERSSWTEEQRLKEELALKDFCIRYRLHSSEELIANPDFIGQLISNEEIDAEFLKRPKLKAAYQARIAKTHFEYVQKTAFYEEAPEFQREQTEKFLRQLNAMKK
jgi:hypothetical protein